MLNNKQLNFILAVFLFLLFCSNVHPFHTHPLRNFFHDFLSVFALVTGIGLLVCVPKVELRVPSAIAVPVGLAIVVALQVFNGFISQPMDSFYPLVDFLCLGLAMILGATLIPDSGDLPTLSQNFSWFFVCLGLISVLFQHVQLAGLHAMPIVMDTDHNAALRPFANFAQPNILALILCLALASVWWLYSTRKITARISVGMVIPLLWGITLTQSRIGWIILPIFMMVCWFQPPDTAPLYRRVLLGLMLLYIALVLTAPGLLAHAGIFIETAGERAGQTSVRTVLWQQAWAMSVLHPWFGVGWLQFGVHQVQLAAFFKPTELSDYAHNIILNFVAELGWPITILLVVCTTYWFKSSCLSRWQKPEVRYFSLIFLAIAAHSMVEFPLWNATILIPFGVMVGAVHNKDLGVSKIGLSRPWIISFLILSLSFMAFACWDYVRVVNTFQALRQRGPTTTVAAESINPGFTLFPQYYDFFRIDQVNVYPGMPRGDIAFLEKMSLNFGFPPVLERLALAYAINNRQREALQVLISYQHLHEIYYPRVYKMWQTYATDQPEIFAEIFKRMPVPKDDTLRPNDKIAPSN